MGEKISTGSYQLDWFLKGGYDKDIINTIYGPAGSGKTNLCLLASVSEARKGNKIIFIDTEGGFSTERLAQITNEEVMQNIILLRVTSFKEQREAFNKLLGEIRDKKISLIVVDGIAMLYRLQVGAAISANDKKSIQDINRALARQLRILGEIASKKKICVIVTNQVYSEFIDRERISQLDKDLAVRMVGGDLLKYWSKCLIELQTRGKIKKLILRKHRSLPEREFPFMITRSGIVRIRRFF